MSLRFRVLLGRFLTRSGDQAWDFAVPLVLLQVIPGNLRIAALYYLLIRIAVVFFFPKISSLIDRVNRLKAAQIGIWLQLIGVVFSYLCVLGLSKLNFLDFSSPEFVSVFTLLVLSGIIGQLGSLFMDISVANDLVPSIFSGHELTHFNSRLRQLDLFTEVASPVLTGGLMLLTSPAIPLLGFSLVSLWNVISFFPEYSLLKSIFKSRPDLKEKSVKTLTPLKESIFHQLKSGWRSFFRQPVSGAVLAYALLWLSVLSPHGVLLTAFLKDGWQVPELTIGIFRGAGAIFGLLATFAFPFAVKRMSVNAASLLFLGFQTTMVILAYAFFRVGNEVGQAGFLVFILLSRIGLYGFSLGETQIRQTMISDSERGEVNGFASALTALATIGLFAFGVLLPTTEDFKILVLSSVGFVVLSLVIFGKWSQRVRQL